MFFNLPDLSPVVPKCVDCCKTHPPRAVLPPSPFQSIAAYGFLPTVSEAAAIRNFVQDIDAQIACREHAILTLEASPALDRLVCECVQLRRHSEQHKALIAPIQRVPPEIIAEIFLWSAQLEARWSELWIQLHSSDSREVERRQSDLIEPRIHRAPMLFGEICREWRNVALTTPRLWNSIALRCSTPTDLQCNVHLCDTWLKRSGMLPLSIRVYRDSCARLSIVTCTTHYENLLKTILPYANRWRWLHLDFPSHSYHIFDRLSPAAVPRLESLSVVHSDEPPNALYPRWTGFQVTPKLYDLKFDRIGAANIRVGVDQPTFAWSQLTRIEVGDCSVDDCLAILAQAPVAKICVFGVERGSHLEAHVITHPTLQTLTIKSSVTLRSFWNRLKCLSLSTLVVRMEGHPETAEDLPHFIARCSGTIEDFTLRGSGLNDSQFLACLHNMPILRNLYVSEHGAGTQLTDRLWESLSISRPRLIPKLESLTLAGGQSFRDKKLARMLMSRTRRGRRNSPLKTVDLYIHRKMSDAGFSKIYNCVHSGLGLQLQIDLEYDEDVVTDSDDSGDSDEDLSSDEEDGYSSE
ncbi:hypothetical protein B0H10DRAFT_520341 [Mycena sp. CBHHK59/15]|nr:hypothetical protein B0H10DRAFT_520341 [Mycena sp. CBHHK59/15]